MLTADRHALAAVRAAAHPLTGAPGDFAPLLARIGEAQYVLLGEASHGTHEFYRIRAEITKRLIVEQGFNAIAVEADWPDAYRVNRFVRGVPGADDATEALARLRAVPPVDVAERGRARLRGLAAGPQRREARAGSRSGSTGSTSTACAPRWRRCSTTCGWWTRRAARRAAERYACFDHFGPDPQTYGYAAAAGLAPTCETEVIRQLVELRGVGGGVREARRPGRRRTRSSSPRRTRRWWPAPSATTARCSWAG